ncbi:hypothetical protein IJG89_01985 [Candidatus Saccharibacteria bacterium]|nr:hypothetical protein [Candidatus Saccharibacteria bacterium]
MCYVAATSIDENIGEARVVIEGGTITVPSNTDDPIVELFRPIRAENMDELLFVILVHRAADGRTICSLIPSNKRGRPAEELAAVASKLLKGEDGVVEKYKKILELYFTSPDGLETYIKAAQKGDLEGCNASIKSFVASRGLKMPSLKKTRAKKTRAQKRASSKAYLAEHPELSSSEEPAS